MSEKKARSPKQLAHDSKLRKLAQEKREAMVAVQREQTDTERWQDTVSAFQGATEKRKETIETWRAEDWKPRTPPELEELQSATRTETLEVRETDPIPREIESERTGFARDLPRIDHSREVALRAEEIRREEWRKAIEEDVKRKGPNPFPNPRLPMLPASQTFRQIDLSEYSIPEDAVIPKGHAPKWVGMRDRLASGKDSMAQVREHQQYHYDYVKDKAGRPIVTELGVLMSATYDAAAARQHHLTPVGSMKTGDSTERLHSVADQVNHRAGRRLVDVRELPAHQRRVSDRLDDG